MILRPADVQDAASLAQLMTQLGYASTADEMVDRLRAVGQSPDYHTIIAEADGGSSDSLEWQSGGITKRNGLYGRILALVVAESAQGKGFGRALMGDAEAWLRARGARTVYINSGHHRKAAHWFYRSCGYSDTGVRFVKELEG
jgi:GNAT superfamily N-acetyltransferase